MFAVTALLLLSATPARVHLVDETACTSTPGLEEAFAVRLPQLAFAERGATPEGDDRLVRLRASGGGQVLRVEHASGAVELERELTADCEALADLAAAIVERHFTEVRWGVAPRVELAAAAPPPASEPPREGVDWSLRALVGFGGGSDGSLARPRLALDVAGGTERFTVGVLAGTSFEQRVPITVAGRERGEVRSRVDDVLGALSVCHQLWRLRGCAGGLAGVLLLSGRARGNLGQLDDTTLVAFAAGATLSLSIDVTSHLFIGARGLAALPVNPLTLAVEGADAQTTVSFAAQGSLGVGWRFF
ncbi:MAG: hypothetical protein ACOZQL_37255 [Myxococcota bacterium]